MLAGKAEKRQFNRHKIYQVVINSMKKNKQGKGNRETGGGGGCRLHIWRVR